VTSDSRASEAVDGCFSIFDREKEGLRGVATALLCSALLVGWLLSIFLGWLQKAFAPVVLGHSMGRGRAITFSASSFERENYSAAATEAPGALWHLL